MEVASAIDDIITNEVFLGEGADSASMHGHENVYDNVVVLGLNRADLPLESLENRDSLVVEGDRILRNVVVGGDTANEVDYRVTTGDVANPDGSFNWELNTLTAIPVGEVDPAAPLPDGTRFDVNADVTGATAVTTEVAAVAGDVVLEGTDPVLANATVKVGLDLDRDGTVDVEYEVASDQNGFWVLDTALETPVRGDFPETGLTVGQEFDVSQIVFDRDDGAGRSEVATEQSVAGGEAMVSGVAKIPNVGVNAEVKVGLDLDRDGVVDVEYDVMTDACRKLEPGYHGRDPGERRVSCSRTGGRAVLRRD